MANNLNWSFYQIWNQSLEQRPERKIQPRSRIWASELGGAMVDRYLKMTGVEPSNPPNPRSLRKFEAGNLWEWIVGVVLKRAGILLDSQGWVEFCYAGFLPVTGKLDFLAGGKPDWDKSKHEIQHFGFPEFIERVAVDVLNHFATKFPLGMKEVVLEIKSCSSFMFEKYEALNNADPKHILQAYHYLKAKNMPEAHIVYVSREDCRMLEVGVFQPSPAEDIYFHDIKAMTEYIESKTQPDLEPHIVFNEELGRFSPNWKVMYSGYLTKLYGFKDQMEFEDKYRPQTAQWNRVVQRMVESKALTKMNLEIIKEIEKQVDIYKIVVKLKEEYERQQSRNKTVS